MAGGACARLGQCHLTHPRPHADDATDKDLSDLVSEMEMMKMIDLFLSVCFF